MNMGELTCHTVAATQADKLVNRQMIPLPKQKIALASQQRVHFRLAHWGVLPVFK
jgi:hypothetical protein